MKLRIRSNGNGFIEIELHGVSVVSGCVTVTRAQYARIHRASAELGGGPMRFSVDAAPVLVTEQCKAEQYMNKPSTADDRAISPHDSSHKTRQLTQDEQIAELKYDAAMHSCWRQLLSSQHDTGPCNASANPFTNNEGAHAYQQVLHARISDGEISWEEVSAWRSNYTMRNPDCQAPVHDRVPRLEDRVYQRHILATVVQPQPQE